MTKVESPGGATGAVLVNDNVEKEDRQRDGDDEEDKEESGTLPRAVTSTRLDRDRGTIKDLSICVPTKLYT